jgi:murein DD-endopeptidase MepM/ murein hydrolase activator NlpD
MLAVVILRQQGDPGALASGSDSPAGRLEETGTPEDLEKIEAVAPADPTDPADRADRADRAGPPEAAPSASGTEAAEKAAGGEPAGAENPATDAGESFASEEDAAQADPDVDPEPGKERIAGVIAKGDTAAALLERWMPTNRVYAMLEASRKAHSLANIREGQPYMLVRDAATGDVERFEYEADSNRRLVILADGERFDAKLEDIAYDIRLALVQGSIANNFFLAMGDAGEEPALAMNVADIFAWEINFIKDVRVGDSFSVLVEKRWRDGAFSDYGRVLAASFTNQGARYEAFRFADGAGVYRYFNAKGESLEKTLLKAPLPFSRVTSGYTMKRFHPVYRVNRPHQGVDYGAPAGTPIKAVGSGVVTSMGWNGGYGRQVIVRHSGSLESLYSHMSRYAKNIKGGARVRQGQVIGYVGSSGVATGPHLDFRLRQNGVFINPAKAVNPRIHDLEKKHLPAFGEQVARLRGYLEGATELAEYRTE